MISKQQDAISEYTHAQNRIKTVMDNFEIKQYECGQDLSQTQDDDRVKHINMLEDLLDDVQIRWGKSCQWSESLEYAIRELYKPYSIPSKQALEEAYQAGLNELEAYHLGYEEGQKDRPTGHWIYRKNDCSCVRWDKWECSECHESVEYKTKFCPNCGCPMEIER